MSNVGGESRRRTAGGVRLSRVVTVVNPTAFVLSGQQRCGGCLGHADVVATMGDRDRDPSSLTQPSPVSISEAAVFVASTPRRVKPPAVHAPPLPTATAAREAPAAVAAVAAEEPASRATPGDAAAAAASAAPAKMPLEALTAVATAAAAGGGDAVLKKSVGITVAPTMIIPSVPFPEQEAEYETSESEDAEDYKKGMWTSSAGEPLGLCWFFLSAFVLCPGLPL